MIVQETKEVGCLTLAERLAEGPIPVKDALRYAMLLGEALRRLHDSGKSHGAVSPEAILITPEGIELLPPAETARPADVPADIFAFGTILGQMLAMPARLPDEQPAEGEDRDHGIAALIAACLFKDPAGRMPSMQKVILELKLATLSARHSGMWGRRHDSDAAMRAEIQRAESRQEVRIQEQELRIAGKQQATSDALNSMLTEMDAMEGRLADVSRAAVSATSRLDELENGFNTAIQQLGAKLAETIRNVEQDIGAQTAIVEAVRRSMSQTDDLLGRVVETVEAKLSDAQRSAEEYASRIEILERTIPSVAGQNARLESRLTDGLRQVQTDMAAQAAALESVRKSMAQTDDLVGRVVEAVESILDLSAVRA